MTAPPDVHIGIVSWNVAVHLDRCLAALPEAIGGLDARIVVVDNASDDDSVATAQKHDGVEVVVNDENTGYARGINRALAGATAPVLIALNPDTIPPPGSLATLVERVGAAADVGLVAPRLVNPDGTTQHSVYRFPSAKVAAVVSFVPRVLLRRGLGARWWLEGFSPHDRSTDIDWAIGAVHVMRAEAVGVPPYRERWFMYVEDLDVCWRLASGGWRRRLEADVSIVHVGNASGAQAWGEARTERWLSATYDWSRDARGRLATLWWGIVTVAGLVWLAGTRLVRRDRLGAREFIRLLKLNMRELQRH